MSDNLVAAYIGLASAIMSIAISTLVTLWINRGTRARQERQWLKDQVNQYVVLSLQYPKLDDDQFAREWHAGDRSDDALRYENFCCFAFNLLERAWVHTSGIKSKLRDIVFYEELVLRHKGWWQKDRLNNFGYEAGFKQFVDTIIKSEN